jgi:multicomponent Na+:H+ antiporter subunit B
MKMRQREGQGMTLIVKTVTRLTIGFILLYGIYITLSGHVSPGGGFAGGVIVALALVLIMLAFGKDAFLMPLYAHALRVIMASGALIFLCGVIFRSPKWIFRNEYILPLCETAVVGAGIFAIFAALVLVSKPDKDPE